MATYWKIECDPSAIIGAGLTGQPVTLPAAPAGLITDCGGTLKGNVAVSDTPGGTPFKYGVEDNSIIHVNADIADASQYFWARAEANAEDKSGVPHGDAALYLPFGDSASPAVDWTANGNDAAQTGGVTFGATGQIGPCVDLTPTDYLTVTDAASLEPSNITIVGWVYRDTSANRHAMLRKGTTGGNLNGYYIYLEDDAHGKFPWGYIVVNNANVYVTGSTPIASGGWHQIALRYDHTSLDIFVDGSPCGSTNETGDIDYVGDYQNLTIGWRPDNYFPLDGKLDQMEIIGAALTDDEIAFAYACGTGSIFGAWQEVPDTVVIPPLFNRYAIGA